jgi:hypothetical protein
MTIVAELISGFETAYGMELLATVHWVGAHEKAAHADDAIVKVYAWNERKKMFKEPQIRLAWDVLGQKGWLAAG